MRININYVDKSTNTAYLGMAPLPPEAITKLLVEKLEKINEHTKSNIKNAHKEKPEKIESLIEQMDPSALLVAANTVTAENLMPWLTGATIVEPLMPMPSGDFIEKLPEAINKITIVDSRL